MNTRLSLIVMLMFVSCFFSGLSQRLMAVEINKLYQEIITTPDHSDQARHRGTKQGLAQVFVKVSGNRTTLQHPLVQAALAKPQAYVLEYHYQDNKQDNAAGEKITTQLFVSFDATMVLKCLEDAHAPIWGTQRPKTLIWWGVEDSSYTRAESHGRYILSTEDTVSANHLLKRAQERGLPIQLPQMDETDRMAVNASAIWGFFIDNLRDASSRYSPNAVIIGRSTPNYNGTWQSTWLLLNQNQQTWFEDDTSPDLEAALSHMLHATTDTLATQYAVVSNNNQKADAHLRIQNLQNMKDFVALKTYLNTSNVINRLSLLQAQEQDFLFELALSAPIEQLQKVIELEPRLRMHAAPSRQLDGTPLLIYDWLPLHTN